MDIKQVQKAEKPMTTLSLCLYVQGMTGRLEINKEQGQF